MEQLKKQLERMLHNHVAPKGTNLLTNLSHMSVMKHKDTISSKFAP